MPYATRTKAGRLYSELVQGVKKQLAGGGSTGMGVSSGVGVGFKSTTKQDKSDRHPTASQSSSFSLYTTALSPFLTAAEDVGRKRLDASFRLSHVGVKISCQSLLRHGHALFTRKVCTGSWLNPLS